MKIARFIGLWAVTAAMVLSQIPVSAAQAASEAASMEKALVAVKEKVTIPEELTEFSSEITSYTGETAYRFSWNEEDSYDSMTISCDMEGRIKNYYNHCTYASDKYVGVTLDEARNKAEAFLRQTAPEAFVNENDKYVYEDCYCNYYTSQVSYNFVFSRYYNGNAVAYNDATVEVDINGDESVIRSVQIGYDYGAAFENTVEEITDAETVYKETFPLEMIYTDYTVYSPKKDSENDIYLVYRIADGGYISAYTGEEVVETENKAVPANGKLESAVTADAAGSAGSRPQLSEAEISELEKINSLVSEADSIRYLKSIPHTALAGMDVTAQVSGLRETDKELGEYSRYFEFDETLTDRYVYANVDAVRGRLTYYSDSEAYRPYATDAPVSEADVQEGNAKADEFISFVAGDIIGEFELEENKENNGELVRRYKRVVNGIEYIQDGIYISYDPASGTIANYSLTYNNHTEFSDPSAAIGAEAAYAALLGAEPLKKAYVKFNDEYRLVYYLTSEPLMNALTGEKLSRDTESYTPNDGEYADIAEHWSKDEVNFLKDLGIAFEGTQLNPDVPIMQADILRIFMAGAKDGWYMTEDIETLYDYAERWGVLRKEERNDNAALTREQAFKYMVCLMGYDTVAKLADIYKVRYADGGMLSDTMIGYAAILSGMGIINGDGSTIRPKDYITRAEALAMVYNYMTSPIR